MTLTDFKNADEFYAILDRYPEEQTFILTGAAVEKFQVSHRRIFNAKERHGRRVKSIIGERSGACGNIEWRYRYAE